MTSGAAASGFGDIQFSTFLSPAGAGALSWGIGPIVSLPSTSAPSLGTQKWSAGPTAAVIIRSGGWTYGAVANQLWSFAGNTQRTDVSQIFLQPFASYTTRNAVTVGTNLEATANWNVTGNRRWTAPLNVQVGKLATFGPFASELRAGIRAVRRKTRRRRVMAASFDRHISVADAPLTQRTWNVHNH